MSATIETAPARSKFTARQRSCHRRGPARCRLRTGADLQARVHLRSNDHRAGSRSTGRRRRRTSCAASTKPHHARAQRSVTGRRRLLLDPFWNGVHRAVPLDEGTPCPCRPRALDIRRAARRRSRAPGSTTVAEGLLARSAPSQRFREAVGGRHRRSPARPARGAWTRSVASRRSALSVASSCAHRRSRARTAARALKIAGARWRCRHPSIVSAEAIPRARIAARAREGAFSTADDPGCTAQNGAARGLSCAGCSVDADTPPRDRTAFRDATCAACASAELYPPSWIANGAAVRRCAPRISPRLRSDV